MNLRGCLNEVLEMGPGEEIPQVNKLAVFLILHYLSKVSESKHK